MAPKRRFAPTIAVIAAGALLAACNSPGGNGEAAKTAAQIVKDAQRASSGATSVHISGKGVSGGTPVEMDIVAGHAHGGGAISENGLTFQTVLDGKSVYLKADAATWTKVSNASVAKALAGKWIKTSTDNQGFGALADILDISKFVSQFSRSGTLTKGKVTSLAGVRVVPVTDHQANGGILYVAATGTPYIVAVRATGSTQGTVYFDQYNTAKLPPDPSGAIDLSALGGSAGG
jgi:predicted small secreted protein